MAAFHAFRLSDKVLGQVAVFGAGYRGGSLRAELCAGAAASFAVQGMVSGVHGDGGRFDCRGNSD